MTNRSTVMDVRSKIATFEAHNQGVRQASPIAASAANRIARASTIRMPSSTYPRSRVENTHGSPDRPPSITSAVSQSRIMRLQREAAMSPARYMQKQQPESLSKPATTVGVTTTTTAQQQQSVPTVATATSTKDSSYSHPLRGNLPARRLIGLGERTASHHPQQPQQQQQQQQQQHRGYQSDNDSHGQEDLTRSRSRGGPGSASSEGEQSQASRMIGTQRRDAASPIFEGSNASEVVTRTNGGPSSSLFTHVKSRRATILSARLSENNTQRQHQPVERPKPKSLDVQVVSNHSADAESEKEQSTSPTTSAWNRRLRRQAQMTTKMRAAQLQSPDLCDAKIGPTHSKDDSTSSSPMKPARRVTLDRAQKMKALEHMRRHMATSSNGGGGPVSADENASQQEPTLPLHTRNDPSERQVDAAPSLENGNDDDITLTSVRQIVEKNAAETVGASDSQHWMNGGEEKCSKDEQGSRIRLSQSSSSEYETDGEASRDQKAALYGEAGLQDPTMTMSASQMTPDVATFYDQSRRLKTHSHTRDDDDNTFDYGYKDAHDDDSQVSLSYEQRRKLEAKERATREAAEAAAKAEREGPFVQKEDVEHYRKSLDTPIVKTAAGVVGAAAIGCVVLGPVGLLIGTAAVGIGVGIMQIPEEQRNNMYNKAKAAAKDAHENAAKGCANTYRESGMSEHIPIDLLVCCASVDDVASPANKDVDGEVVQEAASKENIPNKDLVSKRSSEQKQHLSPSRSFRDQLRNDRNTIQNGRERRIVPVNQIHALDPAAQPRAWLDVLASSETNHDEKMEALEEILILAKDKQRARVFVEEGILDSIMSIITGYFDKVTPKVESFPVPLEGATREEAMEAKLAATCCLTLGKAYCAAIHTEGDLLLMSLYERGTVPEERQLAQMLHEVPYHLRGKMKESAIAMGEHRDDNHTLQQLTLPQAEELAMSIKILAEG